MHFTRWDILFLIGTTLQVALVAYLHHPRAKAIATMLPIPFTLSVLALNEPVNATHMLGALLLLMFAQVLRFLHVNLLRGTWNFSSLRLRRQRELPGGLKAQTDSELKHPFIDCRHDPLPGRRFQHCYRRFDVSCISGRLPQPYVVGISCDSMPAHTCAPSSRCFGRLN